MSERARRGGRLEKTKLVLEIVTSSATLIGGIIAALWGLNQYLGKEYEKRVQATLQYQQRYHSDALENARQVIDSAWLDAGPSLDKYTRAHDWSGLSKLVNRMVS